MEKEANTLYKDFNAFGETGIRGCYKEVRTLLKDSQTGDYISQKATDVYDKLEKSGLMLGGRYWKDFYNRVKCRYQVFSPDEKKLGPAANTFFLSGIIYDLRFDWIDYFANTVYFWWIPYNKRKPTGYFYTGRLSRYLTKYQRSLIRNEKDFRNLFHDNEVYSQFRSKVYRTNALGNFMGFRPGKEYAAIALLLTYSNKVDSSLDLNAWQTGLSRAFGLPDFSTYSENHQDVKEAKKRIEGQFRFLLK